MEQNEIFRTHPSIRNSLALVVWPVVLTPLIIWAVSTYIWEDMPTVVILIAVGIGLLFPAYAWLRKYFSTFVVMSDAILSRRGLLSKFTNEIRIVDIRAINVRQNFIQRLLGIGDVGFSSAAGDTEEVVFRGVVNPEGIKESIQARMPKKRSDGE
jgi:uncharacterized membrane protein YdbT with pleckstrin-like domain